QVGRRKLRANSPLQLDRHQIAIALAIETDFEASATEENLRAGHFFAPIGEASDIFCVRRARPQAEDVRRVERPAMSGKEEPDRSAEARRSKAAFEQHVPRKEQTRRRWNWARGGVGLFPGENGLERGFEPSMRPPQSGNALGNDIVLGKNLGNCTRLFT